MGKKRTALGAGDATAELAVFSRETLLGGLAKDLKISDLSLFNAGVLVAGFFCWLLCWDVSSLGFASLRDAVLAGRAFVSRAGLGWVPVFTAGVEALGVRLALVAADVDCAGKGLGPVLRYRLTTSGLEFGFRLAGRTLTRAFWIVPYWRPACSGSSVACFVITARLHSDRSWIF